MVCNTTWMTTVFLIFTGTYLWAQPHLYLDHAPDHAIWVQSPQFNGLLVDSAQTGVFVSRSRENGMQIHKSDEHGLLITNTGLNGLHINTADNNGVQIDSVDNYAIQIQYARRGIDISGTGMEGIRMGPIGGDGVKIDNPFHDGLEVNGAGFNGARIIGPESNGVYIQGAGNHGIRIEQVGHNGIFIEDPNNHGIEILGAGDHGLYVSGAQSNGIYVASVEDNGIRIYNAGDDGVQVDMPTTHGLHVSDAGENGMLITNPTAIGIDIQDPGTHGLRVTGSSNRAGSFQTTAASTDEALYVAHGDDQERDLKLGGYGRVHADKGIHLKLDEDDDEFTSFVIRNSTDNAVMVVDEDGNTGVTGMLSKGSGSFKIDHPLDPKNKYLYHSFVESPDMMNVYNGIVFLDQQGRGDVRLPSYFEALNMDYRYQLTAIGNPADLYVAQEIQNGFFEIGGGKPGMKVSWQVTGIRKDPFANLNRIEVEVEKEAEVKGTYLHPEAYEPKALDLEIIDSGKKEP